MLSGLGVGRLVVVGARPTSASARRSTARSSGATTRPWSATPDLVVAHTNLYWSNQAAPGRMAGTVETKEVDFGGPS